MGKKKNTRAKNCNSPGRLVSPFVGDINKGAEVVIPFNEKSQVADPPKHAYQTVYMSNENVTTGKSEPPKSNEENSSVSGIEATSKVPDRSSYQSLVDGGAYQSFRTSRRSLSRGNMSNASKYDHESAGDRVLAGSRSISRRSLLSDGSDYVKPLYTSSRAGSGIQWEDFENFEDDDDREKISREYPNVFNQTAKPSTSRVRTVSSNSELPHSSLCVDIPPNFSSSTSQRNVNQSGLDANVRTYLVDSEDFQNQGISKLSIQSSNDEFVLVGGHPPADSSTGDNISRRSRSMGNRTSEQVSVPRIYSRDSSIENFVKLDMPASDINPTQFSSKYDDLGRSISQQSLNSNTRTHEVFISRSSSRHTVETTNTDDRLILAARYSQSPEAEGLLPIPPPKTSSRRSSRSSNSSEKVSQEPFRFTSENNLAPGRSSSQRLERSTSSSSSVVPPESAMLVTSALTPVAPKNNLISLSRSDDSISIEAPQTVQRASNPKKTRTIGFPSNNVMSRMKTIEAAVQTGDSINIRQKQINVLSSDAYHPDSGEIEICTMKTECFVPPMVQKNERRSKSPEIKTTYIANATNKPTIVKIPQNLFNKPETVDENFGLSTDKCIKQNKGDTLRKHVPRGRIRDLAEAFNRMSDGSSSQILSPKPALRMEINKQDAESKINRNGPSTRNISKSLTFTKPDQSSSNAQQDPTRVANTSPDKRKRSTSSSILLRPTVFTRNTFLTGSRRENGISNFTSSTEERLRSTATLPGINHESAGKGDAFESAFEKSSQFPHSVKSIPINRENQMIGFSQRTDRMKKRLISSNRAKTQEVVPPTSQFERRYESRAYSGELPTENGIFGTQKPLFENSELFGRQATEDLSRIPWYRSNNSQNNLESSTTYITHSKNNNIDYEIFSGQKRIVDLNEHSKLTNLLTLEAVQSECLPIPHHSPPITEDAGSRITHYTASTFHDDFLATEESSIRGKIDRLFDFVESDDSRKTIHAPLYFESKTSTDTSGIGHSKEHRHPFLLNFEEPSMFKRDPSSLRGNQQHQKITSTDRRNTVSGPELDHFASDLEYSLAQYRERQKEHVRRRIPSADEPKFFRSPFLSNQHADQSINSYRKKRFLGSSTDGSKGPISNYSMDLPRKAFTTSTPIDSPQRKVSNSTKDRYYPELTFNQMSNSHVPNDTFLSSISRVSEVDKDVEMMRKINRLAYMIENTQKQMSMSEAALMDAIKMGRKNQGVAAHRSILITRETLRLQRTELRRLHAFSSARRPLPPIAKELKGSVVFKNVVVYLNKLFVYRMNGKNDSSSYSFVAIFKYGSQVEATELVPLEGILGEETNDKLAFETKIKFSDVPIDFMVTMEIYAMRVTPNKPAELSIGTSLANMCKSLMGPPQKKSATSSADTAFKFRGRLVLDRDAAGDRVHFFDNVTYPLEGTVMITTECSRLPEAFEVDFRGFLTMYHSMNKTASWERYWAVLRRGVVFFWKYPDDEQMGRETKMQIDLTKCTNNAIEKCGFDLCPRTNTFAIDVLVDTYDCDTIENGVEKRRVLLSADSSQMLTEWLFNLNRTLDVIRGPI